ncbi:MAG: universal stress protein, partial [Polaromonas sp.]
MFKHILVPVDGSSTAQQAIDRAVAIAEAFKST